MNEEQFLEMLQRMRLKQCSNLKCCVDPFSRALNYSIIHFLDDFIREVNSLREDDAAWEEP